MVVCGVCVCVAVCCVNLFRRRSMDLVGHSKELSDYEDQAKHLLKVRKGDLARVL